jgi:hypothetical protein
MESIVIESDIWLAFKELIKAVRGRDCDLAEVAEAVTDFRFNVF